MWTSGIDRVGLGQDHEVAKSREPTDQGAPPQPPQAAGSDLRKYFCAGPGIEHFQSGSDRQDEKVQETQPKKSGHNVHPSQSNLFDT